MRMKSLLETLSNLDGSIIDVIPTNLPNSFDELESRPRISISLDAKLHQPIIPGKYGIGASFFLHHVGNGWLAEAEIGWTSNEIGWESFGSREVQQESIAGIEEACRPILDWLEKKYQEEASKDPIRQK